MSTLLRNHAALPTLLANELALRQARQRGMLRLLQALFREELLLRRHLVCEGSTAWLPLWGQQALLRFDGLQLGRSGDCRLDGNVTFFQAGERAQPVTTAAALLHLVGPSLPSGVCAADRQRFAEELDNSLDNDLLCLSYRQDWAGRLAVRFPDDGDGFLAALRASDRENPALLLEQWGTLGHPSHPNYKTKIGLSAQQVVALSPEFEASLSLVLMAVRRTCMHIETSKGNAAAQDYCDWFSDTFPTPWREWQQAMASCGHDCASWLPLPVHPFQAQYLTQQFAVEIARGDLFMTTANIAATPTMSFRTVVPEGAADLPHIKLPVALRLTSVQRTVSPKSAVMGPRLSILLRAMIAHERGFNQTLEVLGEDIGLHYLDPDDNRSRHLAALFRANPMSQCSASRFPVPVAALFVEAPHSGRPLVTELVALTHGDHSAGALAFFDRYAQTVISATLSAYLLYGIAFEAHQQNSFILLDPDWHAVQLLVRDFGDLRIHAPTLHNTGLKLDAYRSGYTLFDDPVTVRDKLIHAVLLCHLGELGLLLASTYHSPEAPFWHVLRVRIEAIFDHLKPRTDPARWATERHALLVADWPVKSFVRMRLSDSADDDVRRMPNPLHTDRS